METLDTKLMQTFVRGVSLYQQLFGIWSLCDPTSFRVGERWPSVATADCGVVFVAEIVGSEWGNFQCCFQHFLIFSRHKRTSSVSFCFILLEQVWA